MIHLREIKDGKAYYACNQAVEADYRNMTIKRERITCKNCINISKKKNKHNDALTQSMLGLGLGAAMIGAMSSMMFGGNKMFGLNDDKGNLKEMMNGMVQGFLEHFEFKIDDLKDRIKKLEEDKKRAEEDRDATKERYDEAMEMLDKNNKKK